MSQLLIDTKRLLIRNLKLFDLYRFHSYRSDPVVTKYQALMFSFWNRRFVHKGTDNVSFRQEGHFIKNIFFKGKVRKRIPVCCA